jgi:hypothetical protein
MIPCLSGPGRRDAGAVRPRAVAIAIIQRLLTGVRVVAAYEEPLTTS